MVNYKNTSGKFIKSKNKVIHCLLIVPYPQSSLNDEAARLFMESYDEFFDRAKFFTELHAKKLSKKPDTSIDTKPNNLNIKKIGHKENNIFKENKKNKNGFLLKSQNLNKQKKMSEENSILKEKNSKNLEKRKPTKKEKKKKKWIKRI